MRWDPVLITFTALYYVVLLLVPWCFGPIAGVCCGLWLIGLLLFWPVGANTLPAHLRAGDADVYVAALVADIAAILAIPLGVGFAARRIRHLIAERTEGLRRAEQACAARDEFISVVAHELRTPLTIMGLSLHAQKRRLEKLDTPEGAALLVELQRMQKQFGEQQQQQVYRLATLVDTMLDDARIAQRRLGYFINPEVCDLAAVLRGAVEGLEQEYPQRSFVVGISTEPLWVHGDPARLAQVLSYLVNNADKFSPQQQPIEITCHYATGTMSMDDDGSDGTDAEYALVRVTDHGVGVPISEQVAIFERFHQAQGAQRCHGSSVGFGLGLHLAQAIIAQHGGKIGVSSAAGAGASFWFRLPLASEYRSL